MDEPVDDKPKRTLLSRFSIRALFWIVTISAFVFVVMGMGARGQYWAWGVSIALGCLLFTMLVHAALFGLMWMFAQLPSAKMKDVP